MADRTVIEWSEATWNPTTGCDRVSPGCDNCYALTLAKRLKAMGSAKYQNDGNPRTSGPGFGLTIHEDTLDTPLRWRWPRRVFVNSMSDLFHDGVSKHFIADVFATMARTPQHTYQILTKRHGRMRSLVGGELYDLMAARLDTVDDDGGVHDPVGLHWPLPNVWLVVSVENQYWADRRIPALLDTPAAVRGVSLEPLLGPVDLHWCRSVDAIEPDWVGGPSAGMGAPHPLLDWVIVGGESGAGHRPVDLDWVRSLRDDCIAAGIPFFFKQVGGRTPKSGGRELDGRTWDEYPAEVT